MGLAGDRMPDTCVPSYHCGTHAPGWLRGVHPEVSEGVVSRTVCFTWCNKCCRWRSRILVRNCGDFYVYKLQRAPKCKLRYCGVGLNGRWLYLSNEVYTIKRRKAHILWNFAIWYSTLDYVILLAKMVTTRSKSLKVWVRSTYNVKQINIAYSTEQLKIFHHFKFFSSYYFEQH